MRRNFFFAFILLLWIPGSDLQADVQKKVTAYIKDNADDPRGYQIVKFGKVEKFLTNYRMTNEFAGLVEIGLWYKDLNDPQKAFAILDTIAAHEKKFVPQQYGWKIYHKYRLKNSLGLLKLYEDTFFVNKRLSVILRDTISLHYITN